MTGTRAYSENCGLSAVKQAEGMAPGEEDPNSFYLGGSSGAVTRLQDVRRKKAVATETNIVETLTWGQVLEDPPKRAPPPPTATPILVVTDRWCTEKMDQYDHKASVVQWSPPRSTRKHAGKAIQTVSREELVGPETLELLRQQQEAEHQREAGEKEAKRKEAERKRAVIGGLTSSLQSPYTHPRGEDDDMPRFGSPTRVDETVHTQSPTRPPRSPTKSVRRLDSRPSSPSKTTAALRSMAASPVSSAGTVLSPGGTRQVKKNKKPPPAPRYLKESKAARRPFQPKREGLSRNMSNTAFAKAYRKPVFGPYGCGNVQPTAGGVAYGNYLLSHNVGPEQLPNHPRTKQVYPTAEAKALMRLSGRNASLSKSSISAIRPVPFDPVVNERMSLDFLRSVEPDTSMLGRHSVHASLNKLVDSQRKVLQADSGNRARSATGSVERHAPPGNGAERESDDVVVEDGFVLVQRPTEDAQLSLSLPPPPSPAKAATKKHLKCIDGACSMPAANTIPPPPLPEEYRNNPKVYKLLPKEWTKQILPAGVTVKRGDSVKDCLIQFQ